MPKFNKKTMWDQMGGRDAFMDMASQSCGNIAEIARQLAGDSETKSIRATRKRIDNRLEEDPDMRAYLKVCRERRRGESGGARRVVQKPAREREQPTYDRVKLMSSEQRRAFIENHLEEYCGVIIACSGNFDHIAAEMRKRHGNGFTTDRVVADFRECEDLLEEARAEGEARTILLVENRMTQCGAGKERLPADERSAGRLLLMAKREGWAPQTKVAHSGKLDQSYEGMPDDLAAVVPPVLKVVGDDEDE